MKIEFKIAKKYFFPKSRDFFKRISIISIITVFISVFLPVFVLGIINGFHDSIEKKLISKDFHIQVVDPADRFIDYKEIIKGVEQNIDGVEGYPFFEAGAILSKNLNKVSVLLRGVDSGIHKHMKDFKTVSGEWRLDGVSVVIGSSLAEKLKLKPGSIVSVYIKPYSEDNSDGFSSNLTMKRFKVSGIFQTGYDEIDSNFIFMDFNKAVSFYHYGDRAWGVGFFLDDLEAMPKVKDRIKKLNSFYSISDWQDRNENLLTSFRFEKAIMLIVLVIIIVASLFSVHIAFNVVVADKKTEIGILKVLGLKDVNIQKIFFLKGIMIGFTAILFGSFLSFLSLSNLNGIIEVLNVSADFFFGSGGIISKGSTYSQGIFFKWSFYDIAVIFVLNMIVISLATYFPVKRINKYTIAESVRNG